MLYLVPTPLGNLKDITLRALETLQQVEVILCEDTRTSQKLLQHYQIKKPLSPYHQHNEHKIVPHIVDQLVAGKSMALITDAGTPGISDPAFLLVRECIKQNVQVNCLPGAAAFVPALVNSGIPTNRFVFEGFLPMKKGRQTLLKQLALEERTIIFYESPMRLVKTLEEMAQYLGPERLCCVSRELTKMFEENKRGSLTEVATYFKEKTVKGEIVVVVAGKD
ncbi:MAG: 16S rRNA (cytidine(1402)-2'-O)-methyltransferase [Bacteroidetes bacterium 24-39-8]|jgi:16S rRNA (cytidine1402-2'-O)-methyltransferase|nr:MAG: 16S rRNA (cytidine(1402)-2'-O)-methyltransferase [Sphingobacteriia bacterium 35-40-8]OYZ51402.1 MAG: 16S rRNA (cytidine(1402)-2'-O)-methyltransferase [Bacteroidetes bacterium 24-39-8]OZA64625.1 MAG: 16S rRNA (cytidine(1402)-2'-O)-methyltransferase [Sphingobacteriia bacterium 39-39-8]HQR92383.1 16S rRNA (cytidine(1402)-2'-O)-methyltransferase [Sediminibacterium sp.]HQS55442.1 16S rRNA (cytidine(1402)-2'-O)-methyltransferase [Sediminibacterium sp.]